MGHSGVYTLGYGGIHSMKGPLPMARVSKYDPTRDEITSGTDELQRLKTDGENAKADQLYEKLRSLVKTLPPKERGERNRMLVAAMATGVESAVAEVEDETTGDWQAVPEAESIVAAAAMTMQKGLATRRDLRYHAQEMSRHFLSLRLSMRYKGVPDLLVRSQTCRDATSATYRRARRDEEHTMENEQDLEAFIRSVQYYMPGTVSSFVRSLDDHPETMNQYFKMAWVAFPDTSASEAVFLYYDQLGMRLPRKGRQEIDLERWHQRQAGELPPVAEADEQVERTIKRLQRDASGITAEVLTSASPETQRRAREALGEIIETAKALLPSTY